MNGFEIAGIVVGGIFLYTLMGSVITVAVHTYVEKRPFTLQDWSDDPVWGIILVLWPVGLILVLLAGPILGVRVFVPWLSAKTFKGIKKVKGA